MSALNDEHTFKKYNCYSILDAVLGAAHCIRDGTQFDYSGQIHMHMLEKCGLIVLDKQKKVFYSGMVDFMAFITEHNKKFDIPVYRIDYIADSATQKLVSIKDPEEKEFIVINDSSSEEAIRRTMERYCNQNTNRSGVLSRIVNWFKINHDKR